MFSSSRIYYSIKQYTASNCLAHETLFSSLYYSWLVHCRHITNAVSFMNFIASQFDYWPLQVSIQVYLLFHNRCC